jgi:hypothetical protein
MPCILIFEVLAGFPQLEAEVEAEAEAEVEAEVEVEGWRSRGRRAPGGGCAAADDVMMMEWVEGCV